MDEACDNFGYFDTKFCFIDYCHILLIFSQDKVDNCFGARMLGEVKLSSESRRLIINPGGVGQPRDGDPRASYDSDARAIYQYRVNYRISTTRREMMKHKLSLSLICRLNYGR